MPCEMTSLSELDFLYYGVEDEEEQKEPTITEQEPVEDIYSALRRGLISEPIEVLRKLEEKSRDYESVIDYLFYDDPRGLKSVTKAEKFKRRTALDETVSFLEWVLSPEHIGSESTVTFVELLEAEGLDADLFRELLVARIEPVFTPKFRQFMRDYVEFISE